MEIRIEKYNRNLKQAWNDFVSGSKNATFLMNRDFMEYHSDRFSDMSLLFYLKNKLIALLPANIDENTLYSHQGLTYGGLLLSPATSAKQVLDIFEQIKPYLHNYGINRIIYKAIPHIYHKQASEEDLYALFRNGATLSGRSISSCICMKEPIRFSELRRRGIKKALSKNLQIRENDRFNKFWKILKDNLAEKFNATPVHTLFEIEYLKQKFNSEIQLFEVSDKDKVIAGCVIFETMNTAHVQYISSSPEGKNTGALDYLFDYLIRKRYAGKLFFDFGISTEKNGTLLNEGLISQKEGFGGRGVIYDIYQLQIPAN